MILTFNKILNNSTRFFSSSICGFNLRISARNHLSLFSQINADSFPLITLILCAHLSEIILKILFPLNFIGILHSFVRLRCAAAPDLCYYIFFFYKYYRCYAASSVNRLFKISSIEFHGHIIHILILISGA